MGANSSTTTFSGHAVKNLKLRGCANSAVFENTPWPARIRGCEVKGSTFHFVVEVTSPCGQIAFSVSRALEELQRAHWELESIEGEVVKEFPSFSEAQPPTSPKSMKPWMQEACAELQHWLDHVLDVNMPLQSLIGVPNKSNLWAVPGTPSLTMIAGCHQPLFLEIASYLTDSPTDLVSFCSQTSKTMSQQIDFAKNTLWGEAFSSRWPAFHESLDFQGKQDWAKVYRDTLSGKRAYIMEVFDREKKSGFAMSAMPAEVRYDPIRCGFVAKYISVSEVSPESIPAVESRRLRFCPPSVREQLQPGLSVEKCGKTDSRPSSYPYRVLEGHEDLVVGQAVELQFTMQYGSPFGWWHGHLDDLRREADGKLATASITFRHFPSTSRLYKLEVTFGDSEIRACNAGSGFTGGIRAANESERRHWMRFFPRDPIVF